MNAPGSSDMPWPERWQRFSAAAVRAFHAYAHWLVSISWKRFFLLALLLIIAAAILQSLPPFSWKVTEQVTDDRSAQAGKTNNARAVPPGASAASAPEATGISIQVDEQRIRITPNYGQPAPAIGASSATSSAAGAAPAAASTPDDGSIVITLPAGAHREGVREAIKEAQRAIEETVRDQQERKADKTGKADAASDARATAGDGDLVITGPGHAIRTRTVSWGDFLTDLALLWVVASIILKATYKGRVQAEVKAAQATEVAESETLKRQVVEARMAAMQAQVEPHFLFNTLASIDHLIETDPKRASLMQKNLIALLRASMPTMREANAQGTRDLGRELSVIRPYLEILKVRMEERLQTEIRVSDGLMSAEFPPMMLQSLVENAIKHGLEPRPEGGTLSVGAEIVHGKLAVTVSDSGLGFGQAATAGTGIGLSNIRERLALLYGGRASLTIAAPAGGGTAVTITVPYSSLGGPPAGTA